MRLIRQTKATRAGLHLTLAAGVALLALFLAAPNGAYAAATTSSKSIVACVKHKGGALYVAHKCARADRRFSWSVSGAAGANGRIGASGPTGRTGSQGSTGPQGPTGTFPTVLPSGQSLRGAYGAIGHAQAGIERFGTAISFGIPLASAPSPHFIVSGEGPTSACPGSTAAPSAEPGNLCIYEAQSVNVLGAGYENPVTGETGSTVEAFGAEVVGLTLSAGNYDESGSWAVTAP